VGVQEEMTTCFVKHLKFDEAYQPASAFIISALSASLVVALQQ
jgi:hypothetical protein